VLTRRLGTSGSSQALPMPARISEIRELELHGTRLAAVVSSDAPSVIGNGAVEVRLAALGSRRVRRVARVEPGEGGQAYLGLSFADGRLGFTQTCFGGGGCQGTSQLFRHRVAAGTTETAEGPYRALTGFALLPGGRTLQVDPDGGDLGEPAAPSSLLRTGPLSWRQPGKATDPWQGRGTERIRVSQPVDTELSLRLA
jgi:hypothetical protein